MFKLIKTDKNDELINNILFKGYFIYQFFFVFSVSKIAREIDLLYAIIIGIVMASFVVIGFCALYKLLRGFFSKTEIIIFFIIGIFFLISLYNYRVVMVLANLVAIPAFKNEDAKKIMKTYVCASVAGFILNVILGIVTPFTGDAVQLREGFITGLRVRYGLGFYYTTICHFYFMSIVMAYIIMKDKISIKEYIAIFVINSILFILSDTKAPFAYIIFILLLEIILVRINNGIINKIFGFFTVISYPLLFITSYLLYVFYNPDNKIFAIINKILTGRLRLTHNALVKHNIVLFGQTVPIWEGGTMYIDSSFITMLVCNGIIVTIICLVFSTYFCYISNKTKKQTLLICLLLIAIRSMYDFGFMTIQLSPMVLLFYPTLQEYLNTKTRK